RMERRKMTTAPGAPTADAHYIGVEISRATLRASLVTSEGAVAERREAALERESIVEQLARVVAQLRDSGARVSALGVGLPGLVNPETDRVIISTDLPSVVRGDFHAELEKATGLRTELENDANAAAYGEYIAGAGRGSRDMFYVTIGRGIGGALVLGGRLWYGASGFAGEFGHITIDPEGVECSCGNVGCLETVASAPNIVRRAHERLYRDNTSSLSMLAVNKDFTAADIAREARNGDDFAALMMERTGRYIGTAIAAVINLLNIERIVMGGGVMEAGELILNPIIREAERRSFHPCFEATQIVAAALGNDAVPIGAAMLARDSDAAHA
ncbi:MAG TPA: ROK family protein, partial [Pyrinomonadaceae bacterium]|nr:ROK family protein [Pyrinomonadaceae bacterium]